MADFLTHIFLPLTGAYVLRRELFESPGALALGGFGLLSDFDKFLGMPGLLHSLVTLVPIAGAILLAEWVWRGEFAYAPVAVALAGSHLVLDFVDGGPVPLLYPFVTEGVGLRYPGQTAFGEGMLGVAIQGALVDLHVGAPRPGFNTYGFVQGIGVANALLFLTVYAGLERRGEVT